MIILADNLGIASGDSMALSRNIQRLRVVAMLALGLSSLGAPPAVAQEPATGQAQKPAGETKLGEDPVSVMMKWRPNREAPAMPDFVQQTRPSDERLGYTPLTGAEQARPARKTPAELAATVGKMDAAAARARAASGFPVPKPAKRKSAPPPPEEE